MENSLLHPLHVPHVLFLLETLHIHHIPARIVGGAVRDFLLNFPLHDIDIAAAASPKQLVEVLTPYFKVIPTGIEHGTLTVIFEESTFQITSLREDIRTHGRHAEVIYGTSFEKDAMRRDFTINALYMDASGVIYDYFEGEKDIKKGCIRFIGDAQTRIQEDYLRILRFFRMYACFGKPPINEVSFQACVMEKDGIAQLSRERIAMEMGKILMAPRWQEAITHMEGGGVLHSIFPHSANKDALFSMMERDPSASSVLRLLALYSHAWKEIPKAFVLTKKERTLISRLLAHKNTFFKTPPHIFLYEWGEEVFEAIMTVLCAVCDESGETQRRALETWSLPIFPVQAADIPHLQGKTLGDALKKMKRAWIMSEFTLSKEECLKVERVV